MGLLRSTMTALRLTVNVLRLHNLDRWSWVTVRRLLKSESRVALPRITIVSHIGQLVQVMLAQAD